jgi:hypothetical protein
MIEAWILVKNEVRNEEQRLTYLQKDWVTKESVDIFLALPPVVENRDVELGVVWLASIGTRLIANELGECIKAAG